MKQISYCLFDVLIDDVVYGTEYESADSNINDMIGIGLMVRIMIMTTIIMMTMTIMMMTTKMISN